MGEEARVEVVEPFFDGLTTLTTRRSTRQEPIASAVYRQKMGSVTVEDRLLDRGARDTRAFPMKEYSGGGES